MVRPLSAWQADKHLLDKSRGHCFWGAASARGDWWRRIFAGADGADRGGAPQLDVTGEMSLSYLSGRAAKLGFVTSRDGERERERDKWRGRRWDQAARKGERRYRKDEERGALERNWGRREEIKDGWKGWAGRAGRGVFEYRHKWKSRREEERMKRHQRMKGEAERATRLLEKVAGTGRGWETEKL